MTMFGQQHTRSGPQPGAIAWTRELPYRNFSFVNNSFVLGDTRGANQNAIFLHAVNHTVLKGNRFIYPQAPAAKPGDCYIFFRQNATNVVADGNSLCLSANHCTAWSAPADGCSTAPPQ
jgi:hypothetical protein